MVSTKAPTAFFRLRPGGRQRQLILVGLGGLLLGVVVLASPLGRIVDRELSAHFERVNQKRMQRQMSWLDGVECQVLYNGIALAGRLVSPEGGAIVYHYLYGNGQDLWLDNSYLKTSPVIQRSWHSLKLGQSKRFNLRQAEDWRLSYALNPFSLRRGEHEILLWQRIEFGTNARIRTTLNYGLGQIELPDALIHTLHPKTFTVYSKWRI